MKYKTIADCPENVKQLTSEAQTKWMSIANACIAAGDGADFAESRAWQSIKECWTQNEAGEWTKLVSATGNCGYFSKEEIAEKGYKLGDPTHEVKGVEIFAAGNWNGDDYSEADIDEIVKNFNAGVLKAVPLKVGHDDKQKVAGQPAVGLIEKVYRIGKKIVADISNIPKVVAELINNKAYHGVSAEIAWNADFDGHLYKRLLTGVALLGAEIPAVNKLETIPTVYTAEFAKVYSLETEAGTIKELAAAPAPEKEPPAGEAPSGDQGGAELALKKENDDLKAQLKAYEEKELADKKEKEKAGIEAFAAKLVEDKKIVPAMKERVALSLESADNAAKKKYSVGGQEVEETARECLMKIYEGLAVLQIFTETGHDDGNAAGSVADRVVSLARKYESEKKLSFKEALDTVYKEHPDWMEAGKSIR